jgi:hypothetical protein
VTEIPLTTGPPETVLPDLDPSTKSELDAARSSGEESLLQFVANHPRVIDGWASLGELAGDGIQAYAYFRVGYHRGLDSLRANGWRGNGYVRASQPSNRAFLRCLSGLQVQAAHIAEHDEAERCAQFLRQLDPNWVDGAMDLGV